MSLNHSCRVGDSDSLTEKCRKRVAQWIYAKSYWPNLLNLRKVVARVEEQNQLIPHARDGKVQKEASIRQASAFPSPRSDHYLIFPNCPPPHIQLIEKIKSCRVKSSESSRLFSHLSYGSEHMANNRMV